MGAEMRDWKKLKETDIRTVNREELVDITKLEFGCLADNPDRKMRMKEFVEQVGNPYCFLVGDSLSRGHRGKVHFYRGSRPEAETAGTGRRFMKKLWKKEIIYVRIRTGLNS